MSKTLKRLMTTVLTLAMMIGVFAVGGVQVKAAPTYELVAVGDDVSFDNAKSLVSDNPDSQDVYESEQIKSLINELKTSTGFTNIDVLCYINGYGSIETFRDAYGGIGWASLSNESEYDFMRQSSGPGLKYYRLVIHEDASQTPSSKPVKSEEPVHEHSYSWVTVQEATTEQDGIEEYRCSCGAVAERSVIPASQVFVKGLYGEIKNAPLNGTVTFDSGRQYTMSDYIVKKLAERSDVTTVVTFEYNKTAYRMTIPAGADYSALLADEDYFYGYFYFAQLVGATIEEL